MSKKVGLGRGLGALIENSSNLKTLVELQKPGEEIVKLPINMVQPNPYQPRKDFDEDALQGLAMSIQKQGLLQPVVVRQVGDHYELVAGERRYRALQINGAQEIPAIVRPYSDVESMNLALLENLQREDLNPMEIAHAYGRLMREGGMTQEELAEKLGLGRSTVTNALRLLNLPEEVQDLVAQGTLVPGVAKVLSGLDSAQQIVDNAWKAVDENWSVARAEQEVRRQKAPTKTKSKSKKVVTITPLAEDEDLVDIHPDLPQFVETLESATGERVEVVSAEGASRVIGFKFTTGTDLERIYQIFGELFSGNQKAAAATAVKKFSV